MNASEPRRVAVGINGSLESRVATQYALDTAAARHQDVLVVYAYQPPWVVAPVRSGSATMTPRFADRLVQETLAGLVVQPSVSIDTRVALMAPLELLQQISGNAILLVIGQEHSSLMDQLLTGSVAFPLAARSACPVVVVPRRWSRSRTGNRPVVVALDGSSLADAVLDYAFDEADLHQSEVVALHAAPAHGLESSHSSEKAAIGKILAGQKHDHPDVPITTSIVSGHAIDRLVEASRVAEVLVIGRPHHRRPFSLWTRSVAHAVLSRSECPVVIVPPGWAAQLLGPCGHEHRSTA